MNIFSDNLQLPMMELDCLRGTQKSSNAEQFRKKIVVFETREPTTVVTNDCYKIDPNSNLCYGFVTIYDKPSLLYLYPLRLSDSNPAFDSGRRISLSPPHDSIKIRNATHEEVILIKQAIDEKKARLSHSDKRHIGAAFALALENQSQPPETSKLPLGRNSIPSGGEPNGMR